MKNARPNRRTDAGSVLLAFCAAVFVALSVCAGSAARAVGDRTLWRVAARTGLEARTDRFRSSVDDIARALPFRAETALAFYPEERLAAGCDEISGWLFSILTGTPDPFPDLSAPDLTDAILVDTLFEEQGPAVQRRIAAREEGTAAVEKAALRCVLPVRLSLASTVVGLLGERGAAIGRLRLGILLAPWLCLVPALLAALGLWIRHRREPAAGFCFMGAGLAAGGLGAALLLIPAAALRVTDAAAAVSPAFADIAGAFLGVLTRQHLCCSLAALAAGTALFFLCRARIREGTP